MAKTGFIGGGNMAEAMIHGMTAHGMKNILVSEPKAERRQFLKNTYGIEVTGSNIELVASCGIVILAIKPQNMNTVLDEISDKITDTTTVVSIAAGIPLAYLSSRLKTRKLVRVMPNTPALVQKGMTVMSLCECFSDKDMGVVKEIFMSIGEVMTLPEKYMDAVTAISGSGPAFVALFVEAMIEAGKKLGLSADNARILSVQTVIGTAHLLDTGMTPSTLREMVTSPGGTTAAGVSTFHEKGFMDIVSAAIDAAKNRSEELGKGRN